MSRFDLGPRDPQQPTETFEQYQERTNAGGGWDPPETPKEGPYTHHFHRDQGDAVDPDVDDYYAETWFEERAR